MNEFLKRLALKVSGVFGATVTALALAERPFNVLSFNWTAALTVAGSAAVLALVEGLAGRFTGDREEPTVTR